MKLADLKRVIGLDKKHKDTPHRAESNEPSQNIEDYEDEAASFVEGEQAVIRGVKRPVVLGIGVTLIVTFLIGIFWGMSSDDAEVPEKQHETKVMSQNELNSLQPDEEQLSRLRQYEQNDKDSQQKDVQQQGDGGYGKGNKVAQHHSKGCTAAYRHVTGQHEEEHRRRHDDITYGDDGKLFQFFLGKQFHIFILSAHLRPNIRRFLHFLKG